MRFYIAMLFALIAGFAADNNWHFFTVYFAIMAIVIATCRDT
jgi:hypothetical protein